MEALVVTNAFGGYARGDQITDTGLIKEILDGPNSGHVVRVNLPDTPVARSKE